MKTTLHHLPTDKQEEIQSITETIVELVHPEMIILFGSYSRGNWVEDVYVENGITHEYRSDFDILVITEKPGDMPLGLGKRIRRKIKKAEQLQTTPNIIFHDIAFVNTELEKGQYFFTEITAQGTMLYNTGRHQLAQPKILSSKQQADRAKMYFDQWFEDGNEFLIDYTNALNRESHKKAIFYLHQATENYYNTISLVFTGYKPNTHDLEKLNREAGYRNARFKTIFPNNTDEEKRRFKILTEAYIKSRYSMGYTVDPEVLQWLAARVQLLKELTETLCQEKIALLVSLP